MPAIRPHKTPIREEEWDGPEAVAAAPNDKRVLRFMHAWWSGEDPDEKESYKLPHHLPRRGSAAILPAVRNALARLPVTNLPNKDVAKVERHLRRHLESQDTDR
jgi:hypothetical protein